MSAPKPTTFQTALAFHMANAAGPTAKRRAAWPRILGETAALGLLWLVILALCSVFR